MDEASPKPHGGDVGMVGADGAAASPQPHNEEDEAANPQNRSPPPAETNYWAEEERVMGMLAKCFNIRVLPTGWDIGELSKDGSKAHFTLNPSLDEIKVKWLKERIVTVIFQEGSKNLPKKIKEEVIRAFEDIWMGEERFDPVITRGRVCIESNNVLSYIAKNARVTEWMLQEEETRVALRGRWYSIAFKPWLTKKEIQDAKRDTTQIYFWLRILDVPIDAYCYLESSVEHSIGQVMKVYPPEKDARTPQLINVRIDMALEALPRLKETIFFITFQGQLIELKVANAQTPWCSRCRRFYHLVEDCPRQQRRRDPSLIPSVSSSASEGQQSSSHGARSQGRGNSEAQRLTGRHSRSPEKSSSSKGSRVERRRFKQPVYSSTLHPLGGGGPTTSQGRTEGMFVRNNPFFSPGTRTPHNSNGGIVLTSSSKFGHHKSASGDKDSRRGLTSPARELGTVEEQRVQSIRRALQGRHLTTLLELQPGSKAGNDTDETKETTRRGYEILPY
ncbi:hypothetical protein CBR_g38149 [Chara braunii]|uniref:DUF4283 domain-containing protein n=1 Tax=Chara braunii TaxID=69332 RepID=A0A388LP99_CHABU|nr:hypothetical protein CBR_g38149 [Chara braunii]|eukprot:GBG84176.1 hypothetical protein CBR_g38149 [Chara braunii]